MRKKIVTSLVFFVVAMMTYSFAFGQNKGKSPVDLGKKPASFQLPNIQEKFNQAKKYGIIQEWGAKINMDKSIQKIKDCGNSDPCKALQSGRALTDISYLILREEKKEAPKDIIGNAETAINYLMPPENQPKEVKGKIDEIKKGIKDDSLKGEELTKKLDVLMRDVFEMRRSSDPKLVNMGMLAFAGGFCRATYLAASTAAGKELTSDKLNNLFSGQDGTVNYLVRFFTGESSVECDSDGDGKDSKKVSISDDFKNSKEVKDVVEALKAIEPLVKEGKEISKQDVENIAKALEKRFRDQL